MKLPVCIYVWDGEGHIPILHYERLARSRFTVGQAYRMTAEEAGSRQERRTKEQNDRMWAMLDELADQAIDHGERFTADEWKVRAMHACGHEVKLLPSLDRNSFVPYGGRSSKMTIAQMSELIELLQQLGDHFGVRFADRNYDVDHH